MKADHSEMTSYQSTFTSLDHNLKSHMSRLMGKPTICIGENKDADQLRGNREADQRLCFRYSYNTIHFLQNQTDSFLYLYRVVCVGHVWKPHCWFSHERAHI